MPPRSSNTIRATAPRISKSYSEVDIRPQLQTLDAEQQQRRAKQLYRNNVKRIVEQNTNITNASSSSSSRPSSTPTSSTPTASSTSSASILNRENVWSEIQELGVTGLKWYETKAVKSNQIEQAKLDGLSKLQKKQLLSKNVDGKILSANELKAKQGQIPYKMAMAMKRKNEVRGERKRERVKRKHS